MAAIDHSRLTRLISLLLLPLVGLGFLGTIFVLIKDSIHGRFRVFPLLVVAFGGVVLFILITNLRRARAKERLTENVKPAADSD
jgi:hypothetical protein